MLVEEHYRVEKSIFPPDPGKEPGIDMKVLVVDDTSIVRKNVRKLLERNGYEVVGEAEDGSQAVQMARELSPDLVIMDVYMAEMDGISATKIIRRECPDSLVMIMTQAAKPSIVTESIKAGAANFIIKPFEDDDFLKAIKRLRDRKV